jgi:hypothetical protein
MKSAVLIADGERKNPPSSGPWTPALEMLGKASGTGSGRGLESTLYRHGEDFEIFGGERALAAELAQLAAE